MPASERPIDGFVRYLAGILPDATGLADQRNTRRMKLSVVMRRIGLRRRSVKTLEALDTALKTAGIYCDQPLVDPGNRPHDVLRFSKAPFPPEAPLFHKESALRDLVEAHVGNYGPLKRLVLLGREFQIGNCRVDLLCQDPTRPGRPLVVIELKRDTRSDRLASQVGRYVKAIREDPKFANRPLRVLVITAGQDDAIAEMLRHLDVEVECYRYSFKLQRV